MTRLNTGRDGLQMGISGFPSLLSPFDSKAYVDGYVQNFLASDTPATPPGPGTDTQNGGGVADKINKGVGSLVGLPDGLVTGLGNLKTELIIGAVGIVLLGIGAYVMTK